MKTRLSLVVVGLALMTAVSGCSRCKKEVLTSDLSPTAYAQTPASQFSQDQSSVTGARAIK